MLRLFCVGFLFSISSWAQMQPAKDFEPSQVRFTYMSSEGGFWVECKHERTNTPHGWTVFCGENKFNLHLFMNEYTRENESTYEFHYWADEVALLSETHTQSTWLTVDRKARTKRIVSYLGFQKDSTQLRFEVNLNELTSRPPQSAKNRKF